MTSSLRAKRLLASADRSEKKGDLESAGRDYGESVRLLDRSSRGPQTAPLRVRGLCGLAGIQRQRGQYSTSERTYQRALRLAEQALGPDHQLVATALNDCGVLFKYAGRF